MKSIDSIETYAYGMSKDLASEKEEIKYNKAIQKMINLQKLYTDHITKESIKEHNPNWPKISDYPYRILRI